MRRKKFDNAKRKSKRVRARVSQPRGAAEAVPVSAGEVLSRSRQAILGAVPSIVAAMIEGAQQGNHLHAKFLFEFAGLSAAEGEGGASEPSLGEALLAALDAAPPPVNHPERVPATATG